MKKAILKINYDHGKYTFQKGEIMQFNGQYYDIHGFGRTLPKDFVENNSDIFEIQEYSEWVICIGEDFKFKGKLNHLYQVKNKVSSGYQLEEFPEYTLATDRFREATQAEIDAWKLGWKIGDKCYTKNNNEFTIKEFKIDNNLFAILIQEHSSYYREILLSELSKIYIKQVLFWTLDFKDESFPEKRCLQCQRHNNDRCVLVNTCIPIFEYNDFVPKGEAIYENDWFWNVYINLTNGTPIIQHTNNCWIKEIANINKSKYFSNETNAKNYWKELMLNKAKEDYTFGMKVKSAETNNIKIISGIPFIDSCLNFTITCNNGNEVISLYSNGVWAEIIKEPKLKLGNLEVKLFKPNSIKLINGEYNAVSIIWTSQFNISFSHWLKWFNKLEIFKSFAISGEMGLCLGDYYTIIRAENTEPNSIYKTTDISWQDISDVTEAVKRF